MKYKRGSEFTPVENLTSKSPFSIRNIRLFIAFRIFYNARFYYPVFTILFLDFGLTLEQFALLNAIWAATIVLLEVPSGALADIIGRRNLLVFTGVIMVVEIGLLCFIPRGNPTILFTAFLINRILSGTAEAAASGADEAIAYDTLIKEGIASDWPRVLERQMRYQSIAFIAAMSLGAAVYDPSLMQHMVDWLGLRIHMTRDITLRIPLFLTLMMSIGTLVTALRMREIDSVSGEECTKEKGCGKSIIQAFKLTIDAGKWIFHTPFVLVIIVAGLFFDNCIRMIVTLSSQYYRLINLPEASFGIIGSLLAVMGMFIPVLAHKMVKNHSLIFNLSVMVLLTLSGLIGMVLVLPIFGLIPAMLVFSVMYLNQFFQSHYLNRVTSSEQRATVLSFKGLSFNLAYGVIGLLYSFLMAVLRDQAAVTNPILAGVELENFVFVRSLGWFPWYFVITLIAMVLFAWWQLKKSDEYKRMGLIEEV
ncbi:MAG: MFS transporter [Deltaproteobacteria bacterium]|nr:MFS transporter [Deltaproteobacteria bacterium]